MSPDPKLIYTAQSKHYFYCKDAVCEHVLNHGQVPLNPFMLFDYFLGDRVERDEVRAANNLLVTRADELWVYGAEIANGVLAEIDLARKSGKPVRFFSVDSNAEKIVPLDEFDLSFEAELIEQYDGDMGALYKLLRGE